MVLFGSAFVLGKLVLNTNVPPLLFGSLRMLVVFLCLIPFFKFQKIEKKNIKPLIIFSLSMGVGVTGFTYLSLEESNIVSPVIIGSQLAIPFAIILSTIFLNESINLKKWFFVVSSFIGIILIGFDPELINNIFALILTGGMSFFYAIANVSGRNLNKINVVTTNTLMASTGFIILLTLSILIEGDTIKIINSIDINIWILIIYSGLIVSVGAHMSLFYLYKFYPVGKVLPFYSLFPVFGLVQTFIVFREIPSLLVTLGGIIVVGSVFIIQKIK
tara:strand:- start:152 stop:973 length:822 start_codon:yes stop_codon:yes gene_type:complete